MIFNPIRALRVKREAEINNWLVSWVSRCMKDDSISFASKVHLLSGYYAEAPGLLSKPGFERTPDLSQASPNPLVGNDV